MSERIEVTQADREAAANYLHRPGSGHHKRALAGELDGGDLVQLLARHRIAAVQGLAR